VSHARDEHPASAEEVAEPAGDQQQAAEGDDVGVHHPGQIRLGETQIGLDHRQGDADDGLVDDHHQSAGAEHRQRVQGISGLGHRFLSLLAHDLCLRSS